MNKLKSELRVDEDFATRKRDAEGNVLTGVRHLQDFIFAVEEKIHKRAMVKWNAIEEQEKEFELVDGAWHHQKFFIHEQFRFPDDQFKVNLDAIRNFARGVGHFINERKLDKILEPEPLSVATVA